MLFAALAYMCVVYYIILSVTGGSTQGNRACAEFKTRESESWHAKSHSPCGTNVCCLFCKVSRARIPSIFQNNHPPFLPPRSKRAEVKLHDELETEARRVQPSPVWHWPPRVGCIFCLIAGFLAQIVCQESL